MSSVYVLEPPTSGKVVLRTSNGDIEVELWSKEAPKACRNFVQLAMEGYYDNCIFHRVVKDFLIQGGDPTGSGDGGESVYGEPFPNEIHSRLKFRGRGMVAMVSEEDAGNRSQFFITLGPCEWLNGKNTIFGKVLGDTIFNVVRIGELEVDSHDRPESPPKIKRVEVVSNPFDDILPRNLGPLTNEPAPDRGKAVRKSTPSAVKNKSLLSFGGDEEEEEEEDGDAVATGPISAHPSVVRQQSPVAQKEVANSTAGQEAEALQEQDLDEEADDSSDSDIVRPKAMIARKEASSTTGRVGNAREEYKKLRQEVAMKKREAKASLSGRAEDARRLEAESSFISPLEARRAKYLHKRRIADAGGREKATLAKLNKFTKSLRPSETSKNEDITKDNEEQEEQSWKHSVLHFPRDVHNKDDGYVLVDPLDGKRGKHGDRLKRRHDK